MTNDVASSDSSDYHKQIWNLVTEYIWRLGPRILNQDDVDELAQKTLLDTTKWVKQQAEQPALEEIERYAATAAKSNFLKWKRDGARQTALRSQRAEELRPNRPARPDEALLKKERAQLLHGAIETLPESYRQVVLLCYFDGLSVKEAAEKLGITESAAKLRRHRAQKKLRELLESLLGDK